MKRLAILFTLFTLIISSTSAQTQTGDALVDSLTELALVNYSTPKGVEYAEMLTEVAKKRQIPKRVSSGYKLKIGSLFNMSSHKQLVDFIDSLITYTDIAESDRYTYAYAMYHLSVTYTTTMKYKLAIQIATQMYDESRDYALQAPIENADGSYTVSDDMQERLLSLQAMASAYNSMGQLEEGIEVEEEILEITASCPKAFKNERIDAANGIVTIAINHADKEKRLQYAKLLEDVINQTVELDKGTLYEGTRPLNIFRINLAMARMKVYLDAGDMGRSNYYYTILKELCKNPESEYDTYLYYSALAYYYDKMGEYSLAMNYADSVLSFGVAKETKNIMLLKLEANHKARLFPLDYDLAKKFIVFNDSLSEARINAAAEEMTTLRGLDKLKLEKARLESQRTKIVLITILIVITCVLGFIITFLRMRHKKAEEKRQILAEQKELLEKEVECQTAELREKNIVIERKNRDITDSINYAQKIQTTILPDLEQFAGNGIEGIFAFFRPYNIVSGDFYWGYRSGDKVALVCADCTGHGVPGAFMSMIGTTMLKQICSVPQLPRANEILEALDSMVLASLKSNSSLQDGMDMTVVIYDPKCRCIEISSARRNSCMLTAEGLIDIRGTKRSIGDRDEKSHQRPFEVSSYDVHEGDTLYMFSDGIVDQFGGRDENNGASKRLMSSGLRRIISEKLSKEKFSDQCAEVERLYDEWRGDCEQIDDVTFMGVRF